jgi:nucleoside-diphosphate-sugar epimerase
MRVFLTGATGYIGLAVVDAFVRAGHEVAGLVRTQDKARVAASHGARPVVGDMSEPASYRDEAAGCDGVVHAGWESSARGPAVDRMAIETLRAAVRQPPGGGASATRFFIYTSGVWILGSTSGPAAEDAPANPVAHVAWRPASEHLVAGGAGEGVRAMVVRPGIVYGGGRGIVGDLFRDAANGLVRIIGTGENRWAAVYDRDLADLYVRLASSADAAGLYHACDESDDHVTDIVDAIAGQMAVAPEIRRMPLQEASARLGTYAAALALDQVVRCPRAHALGWAPTLHGVARNVPRLFEEWRNADRAGAGVESGGPAHGTR